MYEFAYGESIILIAQALPVTEGQPVDLSNVSGLPTLKICRADESFEPVENTETVAQFVTTFEAASGQTPNRWIHKILNPTIPPGNYSATMTITFTDGVIQKLNPFGIKITRSPT